MLQVLSTHKRDAANICTVIQLAKIGIKLVKDKKKGFFNYLRGRKQQEKEIMQEILVLKEEEKREILEQFITLRRGLEERMPAADYRFIKEKVSSAMQSGKLARDGFGFNPIIVDLQTACIVGGEIGFQREIIMSILLNRCIEDNRRGQAAVWRKHSQHFAEPCADYSPLRKKPHY